MNKPKILAVIGGGASGLAAAVEAARILKGTGIGFDIKVFEKMPRAGKKILATGNGRCNLTNTAIEAERYYGDRAFAKKALSEFGYESTLQFFESMGLLTAVEDEGRVYPLSFQAASVLDCLRFEAQRLGIEFICGCQVTDIKKKNGRFIINDAYEADYVILAAGGKSAPAQGSDGSGFELLSKLSHKITPLFPALVQIAADTGLTKSLKGIRIRGKIMLTADGGSIREEKGEILFTDYGLSGIAVMQLSRFIGDALYKDSKANLSVSLDLAPDIGFERLCDFIEQRTASNPALKAEDLLSGLLPKRLGQAVLKSSGIVFGKAISELTQQEIKRTAKAVKAFEIKVFGTKGFASSQVTAGGAYTDEFEPLTFASKKVSGLYACGEILNVDGDCGGYNLQWAWCSGYLAGKSCALRIAEESNHDTDKRA